MILEKERRVITPPNGAPWTDFWTASMMHAWNPAFVEEHYPRQIAKWSMEGPDDTLTIRPSPPRSPGSAAAPSARDFGWAAVCAAEVDDL
ncbi:hypothetical protein [Paraburkholderia sp. BL23I1N1]|uniref:linalool dehydratase/isomerase domain-containing protein n=1 Tax=Paraburkholderia sp. BL23I1N1 TaxID=1938802 RepID=UPI00217E1C14|nr:hypothetical protein [Paraburkholderia sp. BL23I1N1]